jgi:predicted transposase YdaD
MAKQAFAYQSELRTEWMDEGRVQGRTEGIREGRMEGRTEGEAIALIRVMQARGVELSEQARARIRGCRDQAQLLEWLDRAATAASEAELLA